MPQQDQFWKLVERRLHPEAEETAEPSLEERSDVPEVKILSRALRNSQEQLKQLEYSLAKFELDPRRYLPQLDNAKAALRTLNQISRVGLRALDKSEKV